MAKNIFEELIEEIERILGGSFRILTKAEGCKFCFKNFSKDQITRAFQNTVVFVAKNAYLKKFIFREKEIGDLNSLASVFLKLVCSGIHSLQNESHFDDQKDFLECLGCQMTLIKTAEYFTMQLILEKERGGPTLIKKIIQKILRKIFGLKTKKRVHGEIGIAVLSVPCSSFPLIFGLKTFVNSHEKWEILQKYFPLLKEREIEPEKVIDALVKATEEKKKDLELEEFEKALKDLLEIK